MSGSPHSSMFAAAAGAAAGAAAVYMLLSKKKPSGFLAKVQEAEAALGAANILEPAAAKAMIETTPKALLLDVQDPGNSPLPGSHSASLGKLFFKASTDLADFKDAKIADRPKDDPIIVNCALGGQAAIGAKLLLDYGFTNVKIIKGGCAAYNKASP
eukprot:CAMPEP_0204526344 /NCGR_PEP_ID=MMETSP0661-20131031/8389_1 /ASSEMBLY_ACC=CAM_ASM_000606 /TAXON_ID=109239 /ORGANISM="Alexandrium margalefi, Strain AMGDE01CS-322" /LENGTH=156 /DNA_ID=CAMNT_0051532185 /DNA_START=73 /DNA_END=543 /DNA_ORIENTATION=+